MEEEAEKLKMMQSEVEKQINSPQGVGMLWLIRNLVLLIEVHFVYSKLSQYVNWGEDGSWCTICFRGECNKLIIDLIKHCNLHFHFLRLTMVLQLKNLSSTFMVVGPLTASLYYATNMTVTPKGLPMWSLVTKIPCKLPWLSTNLCFGADKSRYVSLDIGFELKESQVHILFYVIRSCWNGPTDRA